LCSFKSAYTSDTSPLSGQVTANWTCVRFHGGASSIAFNNDTLENGRAPAIDNARRLHELVDG
jgi:hypothetical protein